MTLVKSAQDIISVMENPSKEDKDQITRAYEFSQKAHHGQKRYSGEPFFSHPAEVAYLLAEAGMDTSTIVAGLLHDGIEDVGMDPEAIRDQFSEEVLDLVDGVTKLGALKYRGLERHTESLRKLFGATAKDIRVLLIKLMDRVHNSRTLEYVPEEKRKRIALETLEIYAPIADRLGMGVVKRDLEDAAFPHAYPEEYEKVQELIKERRAETQERLEKTEKALKKELAAINFRDFQTESRVKGMYSLYQKLERKNWDITKIHDIIALRVLVPTVADCYTVLGIVHGQWRPVPGKIKDYIAFEKPNGYQSIHTTINTGDGGTLEVQIRTHAMHREAKFGIASHFSYKEESGGDRKGIGMEWIGQFLPGIGKPGTRAATPNAKDDPDRIRRYSSDSVPNWVKELAEAQHVASQSEEYLDSIKGDFFSHRVFAFTPKGDVIDLPLDATPIDFAYAIHSDIGNHMAGAKVNGKLASIDTALKNGDIVEILTKDSSKPTQKWLEMARTTLAKRHIRGNLSREA